jgi:hypothetical protein
MEGRWQVLSDLGKRRKRRFARSLEPHIPRLLIPEWRRRSAKAGHVDRPYSIVGEFITGLGNFNFSTSQIEMRASFQKDPANVLGRTGTVHAYSQSRGSRLLVADIRWSVKEVYPDPAPRGGGRNRAPKGEMRGIYFPCDAMDAGRTAPVERPDVTLLRDRGLIGA